MALIASEEEQRVRGVGGGKLTQNVWRRSGDEGKNTEDARSDGKMHKEKVFVVSSCGTSLLTHGASPEEQALLRKTRI
jgi:hypothetical protein